MPLNRKLAHRNRLARVPVRCRALRLMFVTTRTAALLNGSPVPRLRVTTSMAGTRVMNSRQMVLMAPSWPTMQARQWSAVPLVWTLGTKLLHRPTPLVALLGPNATEAQKK